MYFIVHAAGGLTSPQQFNLHASLQSISLSDRFNDNWLTNLTQEYLFSLNYSLVHSNVSKEDSENSAEEDDDEDSNDNEEEHVEIVNNIAGDERRDLKPPSQSDARIYMVLSDFKGEQEGDLSVRVKHKQPWCQQYI